MSNLFASRYQQIQMGLFDLKQSLLGFSRGYRILDGMNNAILAVKHTGNPDGLSGNRA